MKITTITKNKDGELYTSVRYSEKVEVNKTELKFFFRHKGELIASSAYKLRNVVSITIEEGIEEE